MNSLRTAFIQKWNHFFFSPVDPISIGIFRIFFGTLLIMNALLLWPDLLTWYGEKGVLSLETAKTLTGADRLSLLFWLPKGDDWVIRLYFLHLFAAGCLILGLFTRLSSIIVFLTLVSFHHRNGLILNSGDTLIRVVSFFLMFSHAGDVLSLDWIYKILRGRQITPTLKIAPWAQRMIQLQVSLVYLFTFLWKIQGNTWREGTAVYYTSRLEEFQRFPIPGIFENLLLMKVATWGTLAIELSMATVVWSPRLRPFILTAALLLHLGLEYSMNIPLFQWIMLSFFVLFVDPKSIHHFGYRLKSLSQKLVSPKPVFYDGECVFCKRTILILHYLDFLKQFEFKNFRSPLVKETLSSYPGFTEQKAQEALTLFVRRDDARSGFDAFRYMFLRIPLTWPLGIFLLIPGLSFLGRKVYYWVAEHRFLISKEVCGCEANSEILKVAS